MIGASDLVKDNDQVRHEPYLRGSKVDKMLQDPVKGVLVPLVPEDASSIAAVAVTFMSSAGFGSDGWDGLAGVVAVSAGQALALGDILASLPALPAPVVADYGRQRLRQFLPHDDEIMVQLHRRY